MTTVISKRRKAFANKVDRAKAYAALEAMKLVKDTATAKFDESVDVAVNLGIDAKKSDQRRWDDQNIGKGGSAQCSIGSASSG